MNKIRPHHSLSRDVVINLIAACGGILVGTVVSSLGSYLSTTSTITPLIGG